ncbi:phytochelatin synthase family protein [Maritimibacter sp. DP1N21-5]|uniref:phytochelatin synthase family protein n=1 Tax=Maritimibacter sp. DP1N21-5 TaxID=2836867 RepID=UPI001C474935|nr:phytochelatin synthase family protein [Maritimibacter sp. DP1N21-5]MBV7407901.1 phytochelatin synthase family protein [Maritimibacter sp. DP1N21-5]
MTTLSLRAFGAVTALGLSLIAAPLLAEGETPLPKLGENATAMTEDFAYLKSADAPDYWAFAPFVKPQFTTSACSIAAVTAAVNGLNGLPALAEDTVLTQSVLLEEVGNADWAALSAEGGDGVKFDQLVSFAKEAATTTGLNSAKVEAWKPTDDSEATLATLREQLAANEASAEDVLMIYFNQGVVTGDWDGPHVTLIGAYDAEADKVLLLEVDQEWYVPYWTPVPVLLASMLKPTSDEHGPLEGETGGMVRMVK